MSEKVVVAGVGMIPFKKPGQSLSYDLIVSNRPNLTKPRINR